MIKSMIKDAGIVIICATLGGIIGWVLVELARMLLTL